MFDCIVALKMVLRAFWKQRIWISTECPGKKKTNGPNSNKLLQRQWASSQWFFYKLGHNAAVSQSIPHFLWDKLDDLCVEWLEDTHTHTYTLRLSQAHADTTPAEK